MKILILSAIFFIIGCRTAEPQYKLEYCVLEFIGHPQGSLGYELRWRDPHGNEHYSFVRDTAGGYYHIGVANQILLPR
jgi:hypothetical protein